MIRTQFIPTLIGRAISDLERRIFSLPTRYEGLGILNPVANAESEFEYSEKITQPLAHLIAAQSTNLNELDEDAQNKLLGQVKKMKAEVFEEEVIEIKILLDETAKRYFELASEKGASSWLTALPLKKFGYILNQQEFRDALCLRYGSHIQGLPSKCACGSANNLNHVLICKKGGYVAMSSRTVTCQI